MKQMIFKVNVKDSFPRNKFPNKHLKPIMCDTSEATETTTTQGGRRVTIENIRKLPSIYKCH